MSAALPSELRARFRAYIEEGLGARSSGPIKGVRRDGRALASQVAPDRVSRA